VLFVQLHAVAVCLRDEYTYRMHWPTQLDLRINGTAYRATARPPTQKLGKNMRDAPANIGVVNNTALCRQGEWNEAVTN
jgi:hypothetical protein